MQGSRDTRPVWNNINRVNHSNFSGNSRYPHQKKSFIPTAVLTREGLKSTARPTTEPKKTTNLPKSTLPRVLSDLTTPSFSPSTRFSTTRTPHRPQRPKKIIKSIWVKKASTVGSQAVLPQSVSVKGSAMIKPTQTWRPKGAYLDSVNRDNGSYTLKQLSNRNSIREKILKRDYAIIDQWLALKYDRDKDKLIPVERIPKFKFVDEDLVILRAPRKNDVYSLDLKNIIPSGGVTCLVAKATKDEAVLWHRRLGHVNFKNINKLVKGNLVRGLPSKTFKLDHSCLACRKGKQHRASCKKIEERTDETYDMLHDLIVGLENKLRHKVKTIRTPQQNGVAERKNRTLIEAARTMLADSLLPIQFWAEAVNTACYVPYNRIFLDKHSENGTADKEVPLSTKEQALHDELVSLMHQESIAKVHTDAQRNTFEEEKRRITLEKGKEGANST
ncbi:ribonuclease H-like domain-containing protein [Tanacetum coccineum]